MQPAKASSVSLQRASHITSQKPANSPQSLKDSRSALGAYCRRLCARLGTPKGITATAHKLALIVYRMLKFGRHYFDIGQDRYEQMYKERALKNLARKAKDFGFQLVPVTETRVP